MKFYLIYSILPFLFISIMAQDIVIDKNVDDQYKARRGPNMRQYGHVYESIGFIVPYNDMSGARVESVRSVEFSFGYRYKLKLLSFYAIGYELSNSWKIYGIKSESGLVNISSNPLSQASQVDKLSLSISSLGAEVYNRFNFGKRGNFLGNYLDIGIKEEWNYARKLIIKDKAVTGNYYERSRSVHKNLNFIEKFSTLVTARIGINKVSIFGKYRFSNLIAPGYSTPELPPLTAGVQLAF